jgi:hypothetical protein
MDKINLTRLIEKSGIVEEVVKLVIYNLLVVFVYPGASVGNAIFWSVCVAASHVRSVQFQSPIPGM